MTGTINLGLTIIRGRRSVRKYKDEKIEENIITSALEAARLAPTARNAQAWLFGVVRNKEMLKKLSEIGDNAKMIADADACFAVFGKKDHKYYIEDCSAATTQLILALWSYGVGSCWIAGDKKDYADDVRKMLNVPEKYTLVALVPAGYPAEITIPSKKEADEVTFMEEYSED